MTPPLQEQPSLDNFIATFEFKQQLSGDANNGVVRTWKIPVGYKDQLKAEITALIAKAERAAKISETQYWFDLALTEDADAVLMNSLRRQFRNRLAQLQGEEQ